MNTTFDDLVSTYLKNNVGLADNFLSETLASKLKGNLLRLLSQKQMLPAGIGNETDLVHNQLIRSDKIHWLDRKHEDVHENGFFDLMDRFVAYLNQTCYTGITGYEFHYALYEKGTFYKKHLDQFVNNKGRAFTMIMYLNLDWKPGDGGELCIYHSDHNQSISPLNGKCVFFKSSELEHEVLLSNQPRLSITGWLKTS
ncbi:2OG-Fe(II) oxygenase [Labilibaculum sp. K2S]|uniref:2OG-Fe(II) oxygenase n=1 Tax=Labilibaculum sp. K2S TaxID=3056386 RepID=UPI0025A326CF|nr:2OG-Fe(II) oxygenase [Labilibaculum sp. K2S]MDM8162014.1 2OG-Fe(II) oxygenase [Labilibaculum sp. K2S]